MPEDKKPLRHAKDYREKHTAVRGEAKGRAAFTEFQNQHNIVSPLARSFVRHFNNTMTIGKPTCSPAMITVLSQMTIMPWKLAITS